MSPPTGAWIATVRWDEADGTLKHAYDWQAATLGEPAAFTQLGSLYPDVVLERLRLYKVVEAAPSQLTPEERRLAAYAVSTLNRTPHCASGLAHKLEDVGASPALIEQVRRHPESVASGDARVDAVIAYAAKLTQRPGDIEKSDIEALRAVGLGDLEILDLNNIAAYYNYINRIANGLGLRSDIPAEHARNAVPR